MIAVSTLDSYMEALLSGDRAGALAAAEAALDGGMPVQQLYLEVFQAAQRRIGDLWAENAISVGMEHRATAITQAVIARLYDRFLPEATSGERVLIACTGREIHELGARMVADFAEMAGYDVSFLGPVKSAEHLIAAVSDFKPLTVGLSATLVPHLADVATFIAAMREAFGPRCPRLMVGGRAFSFDPQAWRKVGADCQALDAEAAVACLAGGRPDD